MVPPVTGVDDACISHQPGITCLSYSVLLCLPAILTVRLHTKLLVHGFPTAGVTTGCPWRRAAPVTG